MPLSYNCMVGPGEIRPVLARWVITGDLVLTAAAHLGNGEEGETVDMPLVRDRLDDRPLLSGASLAGGLRSYMLDRLEGYREQEERDSVVAALFGGARSDDEGGQSPLIVFDSLSTPPANWATEIRDGVAIDPETGTAEAHKKFDLEVLPPGTIFPLRFELVVADSQEEAYQLSLLVAALRGLAEKEIPVGARRSRGLGRCRATNWRALRFDLSSRTGWLTWLGSDHEQPLPPLVAAHATIAEAIESQGVSVDRQPDERKRLLVTAQLQFDGGLLIRSPGVGAAAADATHLTSGGQPLLPGTSLAGVLRSRALRIAGIVRNKKRDAAQWIERLFGPRLQGTTQRDFQPQASRLRVTESVVHDGIALRPNRVKIDRFTGGVVDGALFDEEPHYGGQAEVHIELHNPQKGEIGLVLLLLKDMLTGDIPLGGTSSIGRGLVKGTAQILIDKIEYTLDPGHPADADTIEKLNKTIQKFHDTDSLVEGQEL